MFDFHLVIGALTTPTPSLVETSPYGVNLFSPYVFISDRIAILFSLKTFHVVHRKLIRHTPNALMIHKECLSEHAPYYKTGAPNGNFRENIYSEDDLRSRIFGAFVVKFLACLPLLGFSNIHKMV